MTIINNKVVSTTIIERFFEITQLFYRRLKTRCSTIVDIELPRKQIF